MRLYLVQHGQAKSEDEDPDRPALGACRTCLVQVEGVRGFPAACSTPVREGMTTLIPGVVTRAGAGAAP